MESSPVPPLPPPLSLPTSRLWSFLLSLLPPLLPLLLASLPPPLSTPLSPRLHHFSPSQLRSVMRIRVCIHIRSSWLRSRASSPSTHQHPLDTRLTCYTAFVVSLLTASHRPWHTLATPRLWSFLPAPRLWSYSAFVESPSLPLPASRLWSCSAFVESLSLPSPRFAFVELLRVCGVPSPLSLSLRVCGATPRLWSSPPLPFSLSCFAFVELLRVCVVPSPSSPPCTAFVVPLRVCGVPLLLTPLLRVCGALQP